MKPILKKHINGLIHKSWSKTESKLIDWETEVFIYGTYSIVTFHKPGTVPTIKVKVKKRPSKYIGNIIQDAWNTHLHEINELNYLI